MQYNIRLLSRPTH